MDRRPVFSEIRPSPLSKDRSLPVEPTVASALEWWDAPRNVWTPIGWPDHYFRFNVIYNGTLLIEPAPHWTPPRANVLPWLGQGLQLAFYPSESGEVPALPSCVERLWTLDGGVGRQGWSEQHPTPVLWTEWRLQEGVVLRQEIFSHVPGGRAIKTGLEPHFAWVRLTVTHVDELRAPDVVRVAVQVAGIHLVHGEHYRDGDGLTIDVDPSLVDCPQPLRCQRMTAASGHGVRLVEAAGNVRLTVLPTSRTRPLVKSLDPLQAYVIVLGLRAQRGEHVDLLVPMLASAEEEIAAEESLGFAGALAEGDTFWANPAPATAASMQVPEDYINRAVAQNIKLARIIAEKDHVTGDYTFLSGSWCYDSLSGTPTSMVSHMFLDLLGHHDLVDERVELFRKYQGQNKPPGPSYGQHPGYLATPRTLTASDWLTDHGAILHQVTTHALLSGNASFVERWTDPIFKACEFIRDACAQTDHDGVAGLLPPAVATDDTIPTQAIWTQAWHYKGLTSAVRFLRRIDHSSWREFEKFAAQFKTRFVAAFRERAAIAPTWTDAEGRTRPKPPTSLSSTPMPSHSYSDALYLDTGPLVLVWAGLMDASDELMKGTRAFFGPSGPNSKLRGPRVHPLCRPVLDHEISSCEPCYSWNLYHAWQLAERAPFLEGMYAMFTGAMSPQTYVSGEHRHGVYGNLFAMPMAFHLARLAMIDDELVDGELHLLRLCPLAWASAVRPTVLERMPTLFGPVDLRLAITADGKRLDVAFNGHWRAEKPTRVSLHVPPLPVVTEIHFNGERLDVQPGRHIDVQVD